MSHRHELDLLAEEIASHFSHLNPFLVRSLAWYVFGLVVLGHCGQTQIAILLSGLLEMPFAPMKQRLREITYEASQKRGQKKQEVLVKSCFAPLLNWVLAKFKLPMTELVLACDATYLKDRFVVLSVSVVVASCAIPVAWHIQRGDAKGEWNPIWMSLLKTLQVAIPTSIRVYVLTDSGLYSKKLYQYIQNLPKWHPVMRIEATQGLFQQAGQGEWIALKRRCWQGMIPMALSGQCFKGNPIHCTLLIQWDLAYDKPCMVVTSVTLEAVNHQIYAIRYWIECGFKDFKRGLFHWEQSKMQNPQRVERLWLILSIGLLWLTSVGEVAFEAVHWQTLASHLSRGKLVSSALLGHIQILVALIKGQPIPSGHLPPYSWQLHSTTDTYP